MVEKVRQPNINKANPKDWAGLPRIYSDWVRFVGPQLAIDAPKLILGKALECITGDDGNCFYWSFGGSNFKEEEAVNSKSHYLERLDWEINLPEMPFDISERLKAVRVEVDYLDWGDIEQFNKAETIWLDAKKFTDQEIKSRADLLEARKYVLPASNLLLEYWKEFESV